MSLLTNLVYYWKLDESSGTRNDSHGSANLTDNNTVTEDINGVINSSARFTSANSEYLNGSVSLNFTDTASWSIQFWAKRTGIGDNIFISFNASGSTVLRINDGNGNVIPRDSTNTNFCFSTSNSVPVNTWTHVVLVQDQVANETRIYINGVSDNTGSVVNCGSPDTIYLGHRTTSTYYDGSLDEVGIWSRALTASEVSSLYNSGSGFAYPFNADLNVSGNLQNYNLVLHSPNVLYDLNVLANNIGFNLNQYSVSSEFLYNVTPNKIPNIISLKPPSIDLLVPIFPIEIGTYTRLNEDNTTIVSVIPISSPLVTDGELDNGIFVNKEQYKYSEGTLLQANESSWQPSYTTITGIDFVPDYNDEDLFEHIYTVPEGDLNTYQYSWRKPFQVTFQETYQSDPGDPNTIPPTPATYSERTATRNIAVSFRTELQGLELTPVSGWMNSKYYYSDTYTNSIIIEANDNIKIGSIINGNTVTNVVKGNLYYHITFTGSNGFNSGLYGDVNVLCGLGIKNKFGILGWFFTDYKKIKIVPEFQSKLENEFTKLVGDLNIFSLTDNQVETVYEGCYTEIGARNLKTIIEEIYQPTRAFVNNLSFNSFDNLYVADGVSDNYFTVIGSGNSGDNYITLTEPLNISYTANGENILSISEDNLTITNIIGNIIELSGVLTNTFKDRRINITKSIVLDKFRDVPASSERIKYYLNDFQALNNDEQFFLNRKNYPSVFEEFDNNIGKFTVKYNWTLLPSKNPSLIDVDSTLTNDINLGSLWDYPSTDVDGKIYIEGSANEQYRINAQVVETGGFLDSITLSGGVYDSVSVTNMFSSDLYKTQNYDDGAGNIATEKFYDYKTQFIIPFRYDLGSVSAKISDLAKAGRLYNELSCELIKPLSKTDNIIYVDNTNGFNSDGWLLIPKYSVEETQFRKYSLIGWEIVYYTEKTSNTFIVDKRGAFGTEIYDFELYDLKNETLNTIPIVQFNGYGSIND